MPLLTRWFTRASLIHFVAALLLGMLMALREPMRLPPLIATFGPVHSHLLMVGWVTQLIFGVMYWMFPKHSQDNPRGYEAIGWAAFVGLNLGLVMRAVSEPLNANQPGSIWGYVLALSAITQWLAGLSMVATIWPRVKGR